MMRTTLTLCLTLTLLAACSTSQTATPPAATETTPVESQAVEAGCSKCTWKEGEVCAPMVKIGENLYVLDGDAATAHKKALCGKDTHHATVSGQIHGGHLHTTALTLED